MKGWVKLHRRSIKNGWLKNHKLWTLWTYCLMRASGIETQEIEAYSQVKLRRGQFIFGLKRASRDLGMSLQSTRTCIKILESRGNINKQSNNQFSVITVLNYNSYNPLKNKTNTLSNKRLTCAQHTGNNMKERLKKDKERLKKKTGTSFAEVPSYGPRGLPQSVKDIIAANK